MTESPFLRHLLVVTVIAALVPATAAADIVSSVNKVRAQGCPGRHAAAAPLRESRQLDAVARQLARGIDLRRAEKEANYHAVSSASVQISGVPDSGNIERIVGQQFCSASTEPEFREIGAFRRGTDVWIALAKPFTPPLTRDSAAISRRVLELTNAARAHSRRCGGTLFPAVQPLSLNGELERAALEHSQDMASHNYMDHTGRDGSSPADRITRTGYKWRLVGENLASGMMTPDEAVAGWLLSPHHCANLMTARFAEMGPRLRGQPVDGCGGVLDPDVWIDAVARTITRWPQSSVRDRARGIAHRSGGREAPRGSPGL